MVTNDYPYNDEHLLENFTEIRRVVEATLFWLDEREFKIEVTENIRVANRFHYKIYELINLSKNVDEKLESWILVDNIPSDSADSAKESLATAFRWVKEYFSK